MPVCVVVGVGNEGIGDHCAMKWAAEGYKVAMLARREENLKRLEAKVPGTKGFVCDVTKHESIPGVLESIVSELGALHSSHARACCTHPHVSQSCHSPLPAALSAHTRPVSPH